VRARTHLPGEVFPMLDARTGRRAATALFVTLTAVLAACGGGDKKAADQPAAGTPAAAAAPAEEKVLNVYNWSDYIAPDTIAKFEAATGIKVNYDVYDGNEVLEAKLLAGRSGFDVVVPSANFLERQVKQGVYKPLDKAALPNLANMDEGMLKNLARYDPENKHAVPYMWGTVGIGYNVDKVKTALGDVPVDSWQVLLDPKNAAKLKACGIALLDAPTDVVDSVLIALGRDPNSEKEEDLKAAEAALMAIRPNVRYFHSSQYITDLANGEICIAIGYNGDVLQARDRANEAGKGVKIAFAIPKEGAQVWMDTMAIPADAPHPQNAHAFINFVMQPEIAAAISNFKKFPTPNAKAVPLVDEAVRTDPGIYPPAEVQAKLQPSLSESPEYQRLLTRTWTRVRTGR
jgi:putrescine transport system substrate-binding protein